MNNPASRSAVADVSHEIQDQPVNHSSVALPPSFNAWTQLTDAYAKQFLLMQSGDRVARQQALKLAEEVQRMNRAMGALR